MLSMDDGFSQRVCELSFFTLMNYKMTWHAFVSFCSTLPRHNGRTRIYDYAYILEFELYTFLSRHFLASMRKPEVFVNDVRKGIDNYYFIELGDFIEMRNKISVYAEIYIILFNVIAFCKTKLITRRIFHLFLSILYPYVYRLGRKNRMPRSRTKYKFYTRWRLSSLERSYIFKAQHQYYYRLIGIGNRVRLIAHNRKLLRSRRKRSVLFTKFVGKLNSINKSYITGLFGVFYA